MGDEPEAPLGPLERALLDRHRGVKGGVLVLRFDHGEVLDVPVEWFFRTSEAMDDIDRAALQACRGRVLDVGGGTGVHALPLQEAGHAVTVLETLPGAVAILRERALHDVRPESVWAHEAPGRYDTILALMNGTGLAGTLPRLVPLLGRLGALLAPGGAILMDSTDPGPEEREDGRHPGEVQIQLEYRNERGGPFPHLYVDPPTLGDAARTAGLRAEVLLEVEGSRFLARLSRNPSAGPGPRPGARRRPRSAPGARP